MTSSRLAFLFPGQGAYQPGALSNAARAFPEIDETLREIDTVCLAHFGTSVRALLPDPRAPGLAELLERDVDTLQMAIYAAAVCSFRVLQARGCEPSVLIGHSLGEIAALVCGGAFTLRQGAEIVVSRSISLRPAGGLGYMAAVSATARRCAAIIDAVDTKDAGIAVDNGPNQTVISGSTAAMNRVGAVAQAAGLSFIRLASAYPFHSNQLQPIAQSLKSEVERLHRAPLRIPVYSPVLGRAYSDADDLAAALSSHLVRPVGFAEAIRQLRDSTHGSDLVLVEMGMSNALVKLARQILNDPKIPALLTFSSYTGEADSLTTTLLELEGRNLLQAPFDVRLLKALLPTTSTDDELSRFWSARGARVRAVLQEELDVFRRAQPVAANVEPRSTALAATAFPSSANEMAAAGVTKSAARMTRAALQEQIVALFAQAMEYPPEVFTEDVALEAELGIDSVKQMELLGKLESQYSLPARLETFRLSDYGTLRKITDFVGDAMALGDQFVPANAEGIANATAAAPGAKTVVVVNKSPPMSRAQLQQEIVILFAQAMEYPPEVFTEDVALEAELGIDSVKQMELLGKLEAQFHLPARPETFRLSDYGTLRKITDFVHGASITSGQPNVAVGTELREHTAATRPLVSAANEVNSPVLSREELQTQIVALFAQAMEYPPEVFTEDVALEAELGIDSVKQMELLGKLEAQYELPPRPESFRLSDYGTLRKITDFVYEALSASQGVAQRSPAFAVG